MILQNVRLALRTIRGNKLRSFLTMLGIIISVASVMTVISVGQGVENQVRGEINNLGANLLFINPGDFKNEQGEIDIANFGNLVGGSDVLTTKDVDVINEFEDVQAVAYTSLFNETVKKGDKSIGQRSIFATSSEYVEVYGQKVASGNFFEENKPTNTIILGSAIAQELYGTPEGAISGILDISGKRYVVVGVMESFGESIEFTGGPSPNSSIYMPYAEARQLLEDDPTIQEIAFRVNEEADQDELVEAINTKLVEEVHGGDQEFTILTQEDTLSLVSTIFGYITSFVALVASLSLLVGAIGIMNIMLVSVTERTREIGLRKALGATNLQVLSQFLIESVILSAIGGLIGVGLAYAGVALITILTDINGSFSLINILLATGVAGVVGILAGLWPAWQAARKNPITSLRHE